MTKLTGNMDNGGLQMSRVIKFRAWDSQSRAMVMACEFVDGEYFRVATGFNLNNNIMQFTGLHDKEGKEIYEGDIVTTYGDPPGGLCYVIVFEQGEYNSRFVKKSGGNHADIGSEVISRFVVIGNVHQNKDLLSHENQELLAAHND